MIRAKKATPSKWHRMRRGGNSYALRQGLIYVRVFDECRDQVPAYMVGLGHWARWVNNAQGV